MPLPLCDCIKGLPQADKLDAIYCALLAISEGAGELTPGEIEAAGGDLQRNIVFVGNSLGENAPVGTLAYPERVAAMEKYSQDTIINNCNSGESLATTISLYATYIASYAPAITGKPLIVVLLGAGGVDVLGGTSAAATYALAQSLANMVQADAGKFALGGVTAGSAFAGAAETRRVAVNALYESNRGEWDHYIPIAEYMTVTTAAYMQGDGQHLSAFGHEIAANLSNFGLDDDYSYETVQAVIPPASAITGATTIYGVDGTTTLFTIGATGAFGVVGNYTSTNGNITLTNGIASVKQLTVQDIAGGFGLGGIQFSSADMGELSSVFYLRLPTGGTQFFDSAAVGPVFTVSNAGAISWIGSMTAGTNGTAISKILHGTATLVNGTVTVANANTVTASRIFVNRFTDGGTIGDSYSITRINATSFTITSKTANVTQALDTSVVSWYMVNP